MHGACTSSTTAELQLPKVDRWVEAATLHRGGTERLTRMRPVALSGLRDGQRLASPRNALRQSKAGRDEPMGNLRLQGSSAQLERVAVQHRREVFAVCGQCGSLQGRG